MFGVKDKTHFVICTIILVGVWWATQKFPPAFRAKLMANPNQAGSVASEWWFGWIFSWFFRVIFTAAYIVGIKR